MLAVGGQGTGTAERMDESEWHSSAGRSSLVQSVSGDSRGVILGFIGLNHPLVFIFHPLMVELCH